LFPAVKLFAGFLYPDEDTLSSALDRLRALWGDVQRVSSSFPFEHTDYYAQISPHLLRRFASFCGLRHAGKLSRWKQQAIEVEKQSGTPRRINIDPGYVDGARIVLASTKDHAHRVYLRDGIYAEVTLRFRQGRWLPFDYTFPDFRSGAYGAFLDLVREDWKKERREGQI
jgi:hypothetical protein